ncbi:MAG: hypothetical protein ACYDCJ_06065 [Gammaproteobacteria bacterium]
MAMVVPQSELVWQPNRAACIAASILAAASVLAALIFMFDRPLESAIRVTSIEIRLTSATPSKQAASKPKQLRSKPPDESGAILKQLHLVRPKKIPLRIIESLPKPVDWQQQIEMSVKSQRQSDSNPTEFLLNKTPAVTYLQQALNAPRKPASMQNGKSYRSLYGGVTLKSDGLCSELQTIQMGPSPSNRVTLAFPSHHCAGDYQPSMAEELSKWADQEAQKHPLPR